MATNPIINVEKFKTSDSLVEGSFIINSSLLSDNIIFCSLENEINIINILTKEKLVSVNFEDFITDFIELSQEQFLLKKSTDNHKVLIIKFNGKEKYEIIREIITPNSTNEDDSIIFTKYNRETNQLFICYSTKSFIYDTSTYNLIYTIQHENRIDSLKFLSNNKLIFNEWLTDSSSALVIYENFGNSLNKITQIRPNNETKEELPYVFYTQINKHLIYEFDHNIMIIDLNSYKIIKEFHIDVNTKNQHLVGLFPMNNDIILVSLSYGYIAAIKKEDFLKGKNISLNLKGTHCSSEENIIKLEEEKDFVMIHPLRYAETYFCFEKIDDRHFYYRSYEEGSIEIISLLE